MSICLCPPRRNGSRRCNATSVTPTGELTCGHAGALATAVRAAITDADDGANLDALVIDTGALVRTLRESGWRVVPPRRRRT